MLRFGHPEDKRPVAEFNARAAQRTKVRDNVVAYFTRFVPRAEWPTVCAPHCFFPKTFIRVPLTVLQDAARVLQERKRWEEEHPDMV